jgi:glycosidase
VAFFQGGAKRWDGVDSKIDTEFDYPLFFAIRDTFAKGQSVRKLTDILNQDYLYPNPDTLVTLLGSHDVSRFMGEPGATVEGLKLAFTFLLTTRGIPQLYYGDEIAMPGGSDPDNRRDFPGGWPGDARNAFDTSGRTKEEDDVFAHVKKLLKLRKDNDTFRRGRLMHLTVDDQLYAFVRSTDQQAIVVILNTGSQTKTVELHIPLELKGETRRVLKDELGSGIEAVWKNGKQLQAAIPKTGMLLYCLRPCE